jgi:UDP-N-acetylmuramoyl-tripeptide--D-alanyl-D-alanine ligase
MGEVGNEGPKFHDEVGAYAKARGIDRLLALGELARHSVAAFGANAEHFANVDALNGKAETLAVAGTTVLIKGSRFMKMERVVQHLVNQTSVQEAH